MDRRIRTDSDAVCRFEGVGKRYGETHALRDVDLTIERGSFVTILGPSGSGKTTLLMALAGFTPLTAGRIEVEGRDVTGLAPDKRDFGVVFQGYALFPHLSVFENVAFPLRIRRMARAEIERRVRQTLDMVQLSGLADRLPAALSGGQQQRVALARAFVFDPQLMLLDEPLSALDKKLRAELQWELKRLHGQLGKTFIYVTHDQEEALSMSSEIVIMRDGRIEQQGAPGHLYANPETRFVAEFLGKSNFFSGKVVEADRSSVVIESGARRIRLQRGDRELPKTGEQATITVRPEAMTVRAEGMPDTATAPVNAVSGRVRDAQFLGSHFEVRVTADAGGELLVQMPTTTPPEVGAEVAVTWAQTVGALISDANPAVTQPEATINKEP